MAKIPECPIFYPTPAEFANFSAYVDKIEQLANGAGCAKIVPPSTWIPREEGYEKIDVVINPYRQNIAGLAGIYQVYLVTQKPMHVTEYKSYAESTEKDIEGLNEEQIERRFWKQVRFNHPLYGGDTDCQTLFDKGVAWSCNELDTELSRGLGNLELRGINTSFWYFGAWKTIFAWHTEDYDLYSINYLHFGKPKLWYVIAPEDAEKFEQIAQGYYNDSYTNCHHFLRHKSHLISPTILRNHNIRMNRAVQREGEFMIIFARAYHSGFNMGFNCAEAVNFATPDWIQLGHKATRCTCHSDNLYIEMDEFEDNLAKKRKSASYRKSEQKTEKPDEYEVLYKPPVKKFKYK